MASDHETLLRQWQMLRFIPRHPSKVTAKSLTEKLKAENFTVTKRTVERDLQTLSESFPLLADERDKPYGWSWQKDARVFDVPGMSNAEALTFTMVEQYLPQLLPASTIDFLKPYFSAAAQRLTAQPQASPTHTWINKVRVVPPTQMLEAPAVDPLAQQAVYEALLRDRRLDLAYQKRGQTEQVTYVAHPLGIVSRGHVIYLVCTLFDFDDVRLLAMHRIRSAEVEEKAARRPKGFDLDSYIESGAMGFGGSETVSLEAVFHDGAGDHLYETPLTLDQRLKTMEGGTLQLQARVVNTEQLRWWLLGFGDNVEVVKPRALRQELARIAAALHSTYSRE